MIAGSYVLGILVDRLADSVHAGLDKVWAARQVDKPAGIARMRMTVLREGGALASFLEYQRSRLRVARSTALNAAIAAPVAVAFLIVRTDVGNRWAFGIGGVILGVAVASEFAFRRVEFAYFARLSDAFRLVTKRKDKAKRAAAVPYKRDSGELRFCLVTTKRDEEERWTFPKGRFDPNEDESLADTALREAREEAGVKGRLDGKRLIDYRYPRRNGEPHVVAAFLLEAKREVDPDDADKTRKVGWFVADDAIRLLAKNREPEFAAEAERVVHTALEELGEEE